jgi:hypothetical protein
MSKMILSAAKAMLFALSLVIVITSCRKNIHKKAFKANFDTWYRVAPTTPVPLEINGTDYVGFAYFPGGGEGTATHMGEAVLYFNQLTYATAAEAPPAGSIGAPVADIPSYPVSGGPLPLIQAGDFTGLASISSALQLPRDVMGHVVNSVLVNKKGDAVFLAAITGSGSTFPISATLVGFNGKALIVGGRGKFSKAVGEVDYEGFFNVTNANDAAFNVEGWISY